MTADRWDRAGRASTSAFAALLFADLVLAARAWPSGSLSATSGPAVAVGALVSIAFALSLSLLPLPSGPVRRAQVALLALQALHVVGHVDRLYFVLPGYDDALHVASGALSVLVFFDLSRARCFLFPRTLGPARVAALAAVGALAIAGFWEILEFGGDVALGTREQDDLADTMVDMLDALAGGLVASLFVAWRLRGPGARHRAPAPAAAAAVAFRPGK